MSGAVETIKGDGLTASVIPKDGTHQVTVRVGRREGVLSVEPDKRAAKALARSIVACGALPGFRDWLASGAACELRDVF